MALCTREGRAATPAGLLVGIPGGKWEAALDGPQGDLTQVAARELAEEAGLVVAPGDLRLSIEWQNEHVRTKVFLAPIGRATRDRIPLAVPAAERGVRQLEWISVGSMRAHREGTLRMHILQALRLMQDSGLLRNEQYAGRADLDTPLQVASSAAGVPAGAPTGVQVGTQVSAPGSAPASPAVRRATRRAGGRRPQGPTGTPPTCAPAPVKILSRSSSAGELQSGGLPPTGVVLTGGAGGPRWAAAPPRAPPLDLVAATWLAMQHCSSADGAADCAADCAALLSGLSGLQLGAALSSST